MKKILLFILLLITISTTFAQFPRRGHRYRTGGTTVKQIIALILFVTASAFAGDYPIRGNVVPDSSGTRTLGSSQKKYKAVYADAIYSQRIDSLSEALRTQTGRIDVSFEEIALRVTDSTFDALEGRTFTLEGQVAVFDTAIQSRVTRTEYDAFGDTLGTWGSYVNQTLDDIELRVDGYKDSSWIFMNADSIIAHANDIVFEGKITADYINSLKIAADSIDVDWLNAHVVIADSVITKAVDADYVNALGITAADIAASASITSPTITGGTFTAMSNHGEWRSRMTVSSGTISFAHDSYDDNWTSAGGITTDYSSGAGDYCVSISGPLSVSSLYLANDSLSDLLSAKANAFTGITGTFEINYGGTTLAEITFVNGICTEFTTH